MGTLPTGDFENIGQILSFEGRQARARQVLANHDDNFDKLMRVPAHVFARLGSVNAADVTWACPTHGVILPRQVQQGYIRRECPCERETRYKLAKLDYMAKQAAADEAARIFKSEQEASSDTCYTWLGDGYSDLGNEEMLFSNYNAYNVPLRAILFRMQNFVNDMPRVIILSGRCGVGKTHLGSALLNAWRAQGRPGLFTSGSNLFNALQALNDDFTAKQRIFTRMYTTPLFMLDDPDYGSATEFRQNTYKEIFTKRCGRGLPTIITTNVDVKKDASELEHIFGAAAASRLNVGLVLIRIAAEDYRKRQVK